MQGVGAGCLQVLRTAAGIAPSMPSTFNRFCPLLLEANTQKQVWPLVSNRVRVFACAQR